MIIEAIVTAYILKGTMANGEQVHLGSVACPRNIQLGTEVIIAGKKYTCHDRKAWYKDGEFDIWMTSKAQAKLWGVRKLKVTICPKKKTNSTTGSASPTTSKKKEISLSGGNSGSASSTTICTQGASTKPGNFFQNYDKTNL